MLSCLLALYCDTPCIHEQVVPIFIYLVSIGDTCTCLAHHLYMGLCDLLLIIGDVGDETFTKFDITPAVLKQ